MKLCLHDWVPIKMSLTGEEKRWFEKNKKSILWVFRKIPQDKVCLKCERISRKGTEFIRSEKRKYDLVHSEIDYRTALAVEIVEKHEGEGR